MQAINDLREYANSKEDWYILSKLDLLEIELQTMRNEAKIEVYKSFNKE